MKLSRRIFAKLTLAIAPFVAHTMEQIAMAAPSLPEPSGPLIEAPQVEVAAWDVYDPFDEILGEALGIPVITHYPAGMVWQNGMGWILAETNSRFEYGQAGSTPKATYFDVVPLKRAQLGFEPRITELGPIVPKEQPKPTMLQSTRFSAGGSNYNWPAWSARIDKWNLR